MLVMSHAPAELTAVVESFAHEENSRADEAFQQLQSQFTSTFDTDHEDGLRQARSPLPRSGRTSRRASRAQQGSPLGCTSTAANAPRHGATLLGNLLIIVVINVFVFVEIFTGLHSVSDTPKLCETHKVAIQEQEIDKVPDHGRLLDATLLRSGDHKVAPEASRLLHLSKLWVNDSGTVCMRERLRTATPTSPLVVLLPLVDFVTRRCQRSNFDRVTSGTTHVTSPPGAS